MRRGCAWVLGSIFVLIVALVLIGQLSSPPSDPTGTHTKAAPSYIERLREAAGPQLTQGITEQQYEAAAKMIRLQGYDCPRADLMIRYAFSEGYEVYCKDGRYKFELENHGGKWSVKAP